jgi:phosphoribosyl 1,2-cyclic phosphodiesterase
VSDSHSNVPDVSPASGQATLVAVSLQSGSNGNSLYVEAGRVRLLFDAGIGGRKAARRLRALGLEPCGADAVIISHDHSDHVRSAGVYHRMFGAPLLITEPTLAACRHRLGRLSGVRLFRSGQRLRFGPVTVRTVPTPHDGVDGVVFVVEHAGRRLGILTDLGHVYPALSEIMPTLDGVFIESNHDAEMLEGGSYPRVLKDRIRGRGGHLSNAESARLLTLGRRLQWACLAHLSQENNTPELAVTTHRSILGGRLPLHVAGRHSATDALAL